MRHSLNKCHKKTKKIIVRKYDATGGENHAKRKRGLQDPFVRKA
jgi:hypothetical protein